MTRASLDALCIMLAMQMRPLSNWSATFRNLQAGKEPAVAAEVGRVNGYNESGLMLAAWLW